MEISFYKSCLGLSLQEIIRMVNAQIKSSKGRIRVQKKKGRFSVDNFSAAYQADIGELENFAEYISGDYSIASSLTDEQRKVYDEIIVSMKK